MNESTRNRKSSCVKVPIEIYQQASKEVDSGVPLKRIVRLYNETGLKRPSLQRYRKKVAKVGYVAAEMGYHESVPHVLTIEMDKALAKHVVELSSQYFGLSAKKVRQLAYQLAMRNDMDTPDNWKNQGLAGAKWLRLFFKRNNLSIRKPEATSLNR